MKENLLNVTTRPDIVMDKGKGMFLWDTMGNKYLDFIGGWAVCSLGHSPISIHKVLKKQSKKLINSSPSFYNEPMLNYAQLLISNTVFDKVWFGNSGAEVNEAAIKLARKYGKISKGGAFEVITTTNSFHGRTLALMRATGKEYWKDIFSPMPSGFVHAEFNNIEDIKSKITPKTVAIMIEPVQGEGGVNPGTKDYIKALRELCSKEDILLIFDEVQTGFGRTGELFAYEYYGVKPDIVTLAKGIGGGFPLSAILTTKELDIFSKGDQGGTFGGQQLAMAVGIGVLEEFLNSNILDNVKSSSEYIFQKLNLIKDRYNISNIRGVGLLIGFDLPDNRGGEVVDQCLRNGLIINTPRENVIRFIPPLIVSKKDIDSMIKILTTVLELTYF